MTGSSDSNRSEEQGGFREEPGTKEVRSKSHDRRNTNRQNRHEVEIACRRPPEGRAKRGKGRVRTISVPGNAKSKSHRKTHQVAPEGTGQRMFMHFRTSGGVPVLTGETLVEATRSWLQLSEMRGHRYIGNPEDAGRKKTKSG